MKNMFVQRVLSFCLVFSMLLSNLALVTAAADTTYCGIEGHEHTEQCYVVPEDQEQTDATDPMDDQVQGQMDELLCSCDTQDGQHAEDCPLYNQTQQDNTPVCNCGAEDGQHAEDCPLYEQPQLQNDTPECNCEQPEGQHTQECPLYTPSFAQQLLAVATLKDMYDILVADAQSAQALTTEELAQVQAHAQTLFNAIDEPTQEEQDYCAYIRALGNQGDPTDPGEEVDPLVDIVTIDEQPYEIPFEINAEGVRVVKDVKELIKADLALLEWDAMGNSTTDDASATRVTGVFNGETVTGYWKVYDKIYALLLENRDQSFQAAFEKAHSTINANENKIYRFWKEKNAPISVSLKDDFALEVSGTLIIVADDAASFNVRYTSQIQVLDGGTLVIQGRSPTQKITIKPYNSTTRQSSAIDVLNGKLYLNACELTGFTFNKVYKATISFPQGDFARHLYMANSTLSNAKATGECEAAGIFCNVQGGLNGTNNNTGNSKLYIHNSDFSDCTTASTYYTPGGAAIRSYAADRCYLQVKNCTFTRNQENSGKSNSGGGAIYWKSAAGQADLIGCTFEENSAAKVGGAIYNTGNMRIRGCEFTGNSADSGGAIAAEPPKTDYNYSIPDFQTGLNGSLTLDSQTELSGNTATNYGGGIYFNVYNSKIGDKEIEKYIMVLNIEGATIQNNKAKYGGGIAMYLNYKDPTKYIYKNGITISGNTTISDNGYDEKTGAVVAEEGGAIWLGSANNCKCGAESSGITISGTSTISGNKAKNGGAFFVESPNVDATLNFNMQGGTVVSNTATENGGAVHIQGGNFVMTGGELGKENACNTASLGGGAYVAGGAVTINGGTVWYNEAAQKGGGAYITGGDFNLDGENAIISANRANEGAGIYLTGGKPDLLKGTLSANIATQDGGGIYIDKQNVVIDPTGNVMIIGNHANRGAGVFIGGTEGQNDASFSVNSTGGGTVELSSNIASETGGAVCINNGSFALDENNVTLVNNQAVNGGAVAVLSGSFDMSAGEIGVSGSGNQATNGGGVYVSGGTATVSGGTVQYNEATNGGGIYVSEGATTKGTAVVSGGTVQHNTATSGGGVYVSGGTATVSNGYVQNNTAANNGGGICVNDGQITMSGGNVCNNTAQTGDGGGMYVSTSGAADVSVTITSGTVTGNRAQNNGGAVGVSGNTDSTIQVTVGVNENHFENGELRVELAHGAGKSCPVIKDNLSEISGGAFYISGGSLTKLNLYCLTESDNITNGDLNALNEHMSTFMMVQGGFVQLSTSDNIALPNSGVDTHGNMTINGTIHVDSGTLELYGTKDNPRLVGALFVDMTASDNVLADHRTSKNYLTISYHENFFNNGVPNSIQTAFDIAEGGKHKVYQGLYAHEGYVLFGWNTNLGATSTTTDGWHEVGKEYTFHTLDTEHPNPTTEGYNRYGDLTLYAIWKASGYWVEFDANAPDGKEWYNPMDTILCNYNDTKQKYPENKFVCPGYKFVGWIEPDGTEKKPGDALLNLTTENAVTVTVKAKWEVCNHEGHVSYTVNNTGDTMTKTCTLCGMEAIAKLTAFDAVYDGKLHEAKVEVTCKDSTFWNPQISYSTVPLAPQPDSKWIPSPIPAEKQCINAAEYTATITEGDKTASVTYTIAKAEKAAPTSQPTYKAPTGNDRILTIYQIPEGEWISNTENAKVEYIVRHYEGTAQKNAIITWKEKSESTLTHELAPGIQVYSVLARYEETDNYLPSECVSATFPFLFQDGFILYVKAGAGITVEESFDDTAKLLKLSLNDGYYLYNSNTADDTQYDITIRPVTESDVSSSEWDKIKSHTSGADKITYEAVDGADNTSTLKLNTQGTSTGENYTAILEIGTAKKKTSIVGKIKEKEHFSDFTADENPMISWDSAFTVYYEVTNFDADTYQQPVLEFSSTLPVGTTIIFRDQNDGSYWYKKVDAATYKIWLDADKCQISLDAFNPMVSQTTPYTAASGKLRLQFIVDFSQSSSKVSGNGVDVTLNVERKDGKPDTVENLSKTLSTGLGDTVFELGKDGESTDLVRNLMVSAKADGGASAYDHRGLSLVLTPGDSLPKDAYIRMTRDGINSDWRPGADGRIIIPVGNFPVASSQIALELVSKMFPQTQKTYEMSASLYLSSTDAGVAPFSMSSQQTDPNMIVNLSDLAFVSNQNVTGISIAVDGDKRLYTSQDSMQVKIVTTPEEYDEAYKVTIELHKELDGTSYGNTLIKPTYDSENGTYEFDLSQCVDGDYCVVAFLSTKGDMILNEAKYYFIIQNPTN